MSSHRILVVDDDARIHQTFKAILAKIPAEFEAALSAMDALEKVRTTSYDLILLDIIMPEMDGIGFLESATKEGLFLPPVVVVSSATDKAYVMQALSFGASSYLFKPIDVAKLRAAVNDYLGLASPSSVEKDALSHEPLPESITTNPRPSVASIKTSSPPAPTQDALEFPSISRAMGNMVFHRRSATLVIYTKLSGMGELVYQEGKLKTVTFNGLNGIDALEAMKSVEIDKIMAK